MDLDQRIQVLSTAPLLGLLEPDALRLVAFSAETRRLRAGEYLFQMGDRSDGGYVVLEGELTASQTGSEPIVVAGPGSLIGQTALFLRIKRPASILARELSMVLRISPTLMRRVLEQYPDSAATLLNAVSNDLGDLAEGLEVVREAFLSIDKRN